MQTMQFYAKIRYWGIRATIRKADGDVKLRIHKQVSKQHIRQSPVEHSQFWKYADSACQFEETRNSTRGGGCILQLI